MSADRLSALQAAKKTEGAFLEELFATHGSNRITVNEAEWDATQAANSSVKRAREALMPDEQSAIDLLHEAYTRLKELGWNDAIYCPKDGSEFDSIEVGSTGIHKAHYEGEWPKGGWWVADAGDLWPSRPCLFRIPASPASGPAQPAAATGDRGGEGYPPMNKTADDPFETPADFADADDGGEG